MHWSLPSWTTATRFLQVLLATCKTGCSLCWMPLLGWSFLVGRQNTQPHCTGTFTGNVYWSKSSFGCVFWHITVCMAQHRRILQTACGRHQEFIACRHLRSANTATLLVPPTRWVTSGDRAFPVAATQAWNSLPAQIRAASSLLSFQRQANAHLFQLSYNWLLITDYQLFLKIWYVKSPCNFSEAYYN